VYPADIDTDMLAGFDVPKAPPAEVAARLLDGLAADEEDIFPDTNAQAIPTLWRSDPTAVERARRRRRLSANAAPGPAPSSACGSRGRRRSRLLDALGAGVNRPLTWREDLPLAQATAGG
jgi:hypothetical protein